jgi:FKBP-type peptidyl-prolyl cis-trans isomerase
MQKGGHMKMVVPSSLAYGCTGIPGVIPPNTPLYFDIVLVNVQ